MVQHSAQAHLTLAKSGLWLPGIEDAFEELFHNQGREKWRTLETQDAFADRVVKVLAPIFGLLGVGLLPKQRIDLFGELIHGRYFVAGGQAIGDFAESAIMKHLFRSTTIFASPASLDVRLWTAATGDANSSGTEVSGGSYALVNVATAAGWADPGATGGLTNNVAAVNFGTATGNWGTVGWVSIEMPASANRVMQGALTASKTVNNGDSFQFAAADLQASIA